MNERSVRRSYRWVIVVGRGNLIPPDVATTLQPHIRIGQTMFGVGPRVGATRALATMRMSRLSPISRWQPLFARFAGVGEALDAFSELLC